jgi:hypothetical protein
MFVLCPHCQFLVALEPVTGRPPEQCPRCMERLQPKLEADQPPPPGELNVLVESIPEAVIETARIADQEADVVAVDEAETTEASTAASEIPPESPDISTQTADAIAETAPDHNVAEVKPAIAPAAPTPRAPRSIRWPSKSARRRLAIASVPLLAIVLLLQSLLADRMRLAADARWRPLMIVLCDALSCTLPPWREPAAFTLLDRDVRPDPHRPGVLHVSAGFRNDARWPQPLPALLLTLSDADGRVAGTRAFRPEEYLAAPATGKSLPSGQSAKVSFDVVEPTHDVVAFTFDFR